METLGQLLDIYSGSETYMQEEVFFYLAGNAMWRKIFRKAFQNCEGCVYPFTLKHSCIFLWSYFSLKDHNWAEKFVEMYYDAAYSQMDWINDVILESKIKDRVDLTMYKERYWQTRQRKLKFKVRVKDYIIASALEEASSLICSRIPIVFICISTVEQLQWTVLHFNNLLNNLEPF